MNHVIDRRTLLAGAAAGLALGAGPGAVLAQGAPIRIGTLTPLTGSGGPYGGPMAACARAVVDEVNAAGGVLGRPVQLISEDDQTSPEAAVRAARKLIDVDKVAAIVGTWSSAVTTAVAPLCWESKTFLATVSGADSITQLPHGGFLVRTQPTTTLQGRKFGEFALELGAKRAFFMTSQTPFTQFQFQAMKAAVERGGGAIEMLIYDDKKTTFRTEVDAALRTNPDIIVMGGYAPDTGVLLRDVFRAGFQGKLLGFAYAVNQKMVESLPGDVTEGVYTLSPSPAEGSAALKRVVALSKMSNPDPYTAQIYDHVNLVLLAMAAAKDVTGDAVRTHLRQVSQGNGRKVTDAVEGLRAIAAGESVDYEGASGPCDFVESGDIQDARFRYEQAKGGKIVLLKVA